MTQLKGQKGELGFTVTIKRKDTGKEETYQMVGHVTDDESHKQLKEKYHGRNS